MKFKAVKKRDILLICLILLTALLLIAYLHFFSIAGAYIEITVDGKPYKTLSLNVDADVDINGTNTLVIKNGEAYMLSADCPDKICVGHAPISKNGQSIVCLPNGIIAAAVSPNDLSGVDSIAG